LPVCHSGTAHDEMAKTSTTKNAELKEKENPLNAITLNGFT
jgi:hypothetical protein